MCCKLYDTPETESPAGKWCRHLAPRKGCAIYESRPQVCRAFFCGWMVTPGLGPEWKPDRAKLIVRLLVTDGVPSLSVNVDEGFPAAWQRPDIYRKLKQIAAGSLAGVRTRVIVRIGRRQIVVLPDRDADIGLVAADEEVAFVDNGAGIDVQKVKRKPPAVGA